MLLLPAMPAFPSDETGVTSTSPTATVSRKIFASPTLLRSSCLRNWPSGGRELQEPLSWKSISSKVGGQPFTSSWPFGFGFVRLES